MAKEKNSVVESMEFFELTLNVPNSQIPISELIEYLRNTDKVFKGVNQTLNEKYAIGYNSIAIEGVIGTGTEVNPQSWTQHLLFICEEEH